MHFSPSLTLRQTTILVVDDELMTLRIVTRILEKCDCTVLWADRASRAIELFRQHSEVIDLLITDVNMPQVNGPELVKCLRRSHPQLRVLYMSAQPANAEFQGNDFFIEKPFTRDCVIEMVAGALNCRKVKCSPLSHLIDGL